MRKKTNKNYKNKLGELWIPCLFMAIPFIFLVLKNIDDYKYYMYGQPNYDDLIEISGVIMEDNRPPPGSYNKRDDGIYIKFGNDRLNIYCDNPKKPLIGYGTRGGGNYSLGSCRWISVKRYREDFCQGKKEDFCKDPRYFYGRLINVKVNNNYTIYELIIDGEKIYSYEYMVNIYRNEFFFWSKVYLIIVGILFFISSISYLSRVKNHMEGNK